MFAYGARRAVQAACRAGAQWHVHILGSPRRTACGGWLRHGGAHGTLLGGMRLTFTATSWPGRSFMLRSNVSLSAWSTGIVFISRIIIVAAYVGVLGYISSSRSSQTLFS